MKFTQIIVLSALIVVLNGCTDGRSSSDYLAKAKTHLAENKIEESIIALKNAIKKSPENKDARYLLGQLYLQQGSGFEARKELEKAFTLNYQHNKVLPLLARAYILTNADDDVIDLFEQSQALPEEVKLHYMSYYVLANIRLDNLPAAQKAQRIVNELSISTGYSHLVSAYIDMAENNLDVGLIKAEKALATLPENPEVIMLLGQMESALGEHEQANKRFLEYAKLQPKSNLIVLLLADSSLKAKDYERAESYADLILSKLPNQPFALYVKSIVRFENQDYQQASELASKAESLGFQNMQLKLVAGASAFHLNNFEQSYNYLNSIIKYVPAEHPATKMFAINQFQLGLIDEISNTLEEFDISGDADINFLSSLSVKLAEIGALDDAKALVTRATMKKPENAEENMRMGMLKLIFNDPSALTHIEHALSLNPDLFSAEIALVSVALKNNDFERATQIANKWKAKYPKKPAAFNVMATVHLKRKEFGLAKEELTKSLALDENNLFAINHLITLAIAEEDYDEANRLAELGLSHFPSNAKVLKQYYSVSMSDEQRKKIALDKVRVAFEADRKNENLAFLFSGILLDQKEYRRALNVLDGIEASIHVPKAFWQLKLAAFYGLKKKDDFISLLKSWINVNPYAIEPVLRLADSYIRNNEKQQAVATLDKALEHGNSSNIVLRMAKMQVFLDSGDLANAKAYFTRFAQPDMKSVFISGVEGRIYFLERNYAKALPLLIDFYRDVPSSQNVILLTLTQKNVQSVDVAIETLKTHLKQYENDTKARTMLANFYLESHPEKSIPLYESMLKKEPNNVVYLNNLAWLNLQNNNLELAMKYSKQAVKLSPKHPNVLDTRGMVLLKAGENKIALKAIKSAYELSKGRDVAITLNYAEALILNQKIEMARAVLNKVKVDDVLLRQRTNKLIQKTE
ncbi:MAG: XrtA/PEP-CTERM system TPR-repeat protein PrsT [Colwellia sp.]